jgi:hypothetical protein
VGRYTVALGYERIDPAYKPSLKVVLTSEQPGIPMIFGAIFDRSKGQDFWEDSIGVTPLILKESTATQFDFQVEFESMALPGDGQ